MTFYASDALGLTSMWCNALYSSYEMNHQLKDSNSCLLFIPGDKNFLEKSLKAVEGTKINRIIMLTEPDFELSDASGSSNVEILAMKDVYHINADGSFVFPKVERDYATDVATLLYSSGTTGTSKGVPIVQKTWRYMLTLFHKSDFVYLNIDNMPIMSSFLVPPMFHLYGLACGAVVSPFLNSKLILQRRFNFESMLESIEKYKIYQIYILPAIMNRLIKDPIVKNYDLSSIKSILTGAASLSKETIEKFYELFEPDHPISIVQSYGMTEGGATSIPHDAPREIVRSGTVGKVSPDTEVKIVDINTLETVTVNTEVCLFVCLSSLE